MIICHCTGATDRQIRAIVQGGADTPAEIVRTCKAGFDCGGCRLAIERIILESRRCEAPVHELPRAYFAV